MKQVYFSTLKKDDNTDIIYEVFSLACSVYTAIQTGKPVVIVDSDKFNLDYLTKSLQKYKIRVLEKNTLDFSLVAVFYGKGKKVIDITDKVPPLFTGPFNLIHGDPCPNEKKELFMCYRLNDVEYTDIYKESNIEPVCFHISSATYNHDYFWLDKANLSVYQDILKNIQVKDVAYSEACHVVHVLSPEDVLPYANHLGKTLDDYYDTLIHKYIEIMSIFIQNNEPIVFLQKTLDPRLETFVKRNGNSYLCLDTQSTSTFSEITRAKGIFIGNFNVDTLTGSACSYYLHSMIPASQSILVDLDMIYEN
jgi:hypothetical protein